MLFVVMWMCVCRKANVLVSFLVDVGLGLLLASWLYRDNHISMIANMLVPAADVRHTRRLFFKHALNIKNQLWFQTF